MGGNRYSIACAVLGSTPKKSVAARAASPIFLMALVDSCSDDAASVVADDWVGDDNEKAGCCTKAEAEEAVDKATIRTLETFIAIPIISQLYS